MNNNLNSILIEGNLVRDPLLRSTPKGTQVCTMCLASNHFHRLDSGYERKVTFVDVDAWARLAEECYSKGRKGRGVRVVGRLKQDRWNDAEGKPRSKVTIVAEHVEFRPEFKKGPIPAANELPVNAAPSYEDDYLDEETGGSALAMPDKELEQVVF